MKTLALKLSTCWPGWRAARLLSVGLLLGLMPEAIRAATLTWDGSSDGYWFTAANWSTGTRPQDGDDLVFPAGAAHLLNTNNIGTPRHYHSITISGANYSLRGNSLTLSNGITATYGAGASAEVVMDIALGRSQEIECATDGAFLYVSGDIALEGYSLTATGSGAVRLSGAIGGTGGITKNGAGSLRLYGSAANTYTGITRVNVGTLELSKTSGLNAMAGDLIVGNNVGTDTVLWLNSHQLPVATAVTVNRGAILDLDGLNETIGDLALSSGDIETGAGLLTLAGGVSATTSTTHASTISGRLSVGSGTRIFTLVNGTWNPELRVTAQVSGSANIFVTSSDVAEITLAASNTFTGTLTLQHGALLFVGHAWALGSASAGTVANDSSYIGFEGGIHVPAEPLTMNTSYDHGAFWVTDGGNSWAGPIELLRETSVNFSSAGSGLSLNLAGPISGAGGLTKRGTGTLILSGAVGNTCGGDTRVDEGTLILDKTGGVAIRYGTLTIGDGEGGANADVVRYAGNDQLWSTVAIRIDRSGWLDLNGYADTLGPLTFTGGRASSGAGGTLYLSGTVTVNSSTAIPALEGRIELPSVEIFQIANSPTSPDLNIDAAIRGAGGLTKTGPGALALHSASSFSGALTVNDGLVYLYDDAALGSTAGGTVVNAGGVLVLANGRHIGAEPLTLNGAGDGFAGALTSIGGYNTWAGTVTLATDSVITVQTNRYLNLEGTIVGPAGFIKSQPGGLVLSGSAANTYAGNTVVNEGILILDKSVAPAIAHSELIIGDGLGGPDADVVREMDHSQIASSSITINSSGWLDLNGHNDLVGRLTFTAGRASSGPGGQLVLGGNVTANYVSAGRPSLEGSVVLPAPRTFEIANSSGSPDFDLLAAVSGAGGLTKTGPGALAVHSANSFSGAVMVSDGLVYLYDDAALGSTAGGTVVNTGGVLVLANGRHIGAEPLTLNGAGDSISGALASIGGSNSWAGTVTLATDSVITVQTNRHLNLEGTIAGPAGFIKGQPGTLILSGSTANTFAGNAVVAEGVLWLDKNVVDGALPGPGGLVIGRAGDAPPRASVFELRNYQIDASADITVNVGCRLDLNDCSDAVGDMTLNTGAVLTGDGTLTLGGGIRASSVDMFPASIRGHLALGSAVRTVTVDPSSYLAIHASVSGMGGLAKNGPGALWLESSNSFRGPVTIAEGGVTAYDEHSLGSPAGGTILSGGMLGLSSVTITNEVLTVNDVSSELKCGDESRWTGDIVLDADLHVSLYTHTVTTARLDLAGAISGAGGITKLASGNEGVLALTGAAANTYLGPTRVNAGVLVLDKTASDGAVPGDLIIGDGYGNAGADAVRLERSSQIANGAAVTIASSGQLDLDGHYDRIDAVTGSGSITLGSGHLIAGHSGSSFTFDGLVSGAGYLWKVGAGAWTLTADNPYLGQTRIEGGTLRINGSQPSSDVLVWNGGVLGGTGAVGRVTSTGGALSPGLSPGTLTSGDVLLDSSTECILELANAGSDQMNVQGSVGLGSARLTLSAAGLLPEEGQPFVLVSNDGADAVAGTFAGLPEGAVVSAGPRQFLITYAGGSGNDVVLLATNTAALRPVLSISRAGAGVTLAWPQSDIGWRLHAATDLGAAPILWTEIPPPYASNLTDCIFTEAASAGCRFYRLHSP
ncbi:MAG TPA: autotransporter-associated beta strand repeat-containing protein [Candidatus Paceibacterota bacterium]|nr:autotransporter-associated beta strand repeat-containing protein [Verrucomicrobiota bacterium]HRZ45533.1 autotransporter-associated beta strand repeat-containing protein [Candidatus Paceibacterota bacterium]